MGTTWDTESALAIANIALEAARDVLSGSAPGDAQRAHCVRAIAQALEVIRESQEDKTHQALLAYVASATGGV